MFLDSKRNGLALARKKHYATIVISYMLRCSHYRPLIPGGEPRVVSKNWARVPFHTMPSIFSHAIFAASIGKAFISNPLPVSFWVLTAACAVLPDADVIAFAFRVPYGSMLGHRGITHSVAFALFTGVIVGLIASRKIRALGTVGLILYFTLVTFSHTLLDMLTNGGLGVALLAPLSGERYFLPWRPVEVSPIGMRFFSGRGLEVVMSEIVWIWLPALFVLLGALIYRYIAKVKAQ